ncbi:MAG: BlaI/MecI/CopY family transcriptional regulator [Alistipes sp.]|nr:BlaI/MecI/CopY family transcriptional regulator [Alistipes sp.]
MKRLPEAEQELMMIIWSLEEPVTRADIEAKYDKAKEVMPSTILTLLSRLDKRGFLRTEKQGKVNTYYPLVKKEDYLRTESRYILKNMFQDSLTGFAAAAYDGGTISREELEELRRFIDSKISER